MGVRPIDFAISDRELNEFGCPVCGYAYSTWGFMGGGGVMVVCNNKLCKMVFYVLHGDHKDFAGVSFGHGKLNIKPELKPHPRKGTPVWGKRKDKRPKEGEFFTKPAESSYSSGLCFICESPCRLPVDVEFPMKNLFSFTVKAVCTKAAERIEIIFKKADLWATLAAEEREYPMECYSVNISSCFNHRPNLLKLVEHAKNKGTITENDLRKIKTLK